MSRGTIDPMPTRTPDEQHLRDLAVLRRVKDRIDREYAQPLDVEALARKHWMRPLADDEIPVVKASVAKAQTSGSLT